ncbi:MAG: MalY/PatB family protein [Bacteroidales bacterium]|nr:MalY/PatB family protein [Bacteroidales bacterium]
MRPEFDFDTPVDRRGSASYKWDSMPDGVLPMWVADMDFKTAPCIIDALHRRVDHGVFGYTRVPAEYYEATVDWFMRRHGWSIDPSHIIYTSGVVPAVSAIIKAMTGPGDKVLVQTPAYNCFFSSIRNNGCIALDNLLAADSRGYYTIDFDSLERQAADPACRLMLLCNPHNPVGRVWTRDELARIAEICLRNDVFVIADEIHCELTYPGHDYTPWATVNHEMTMRSAICVSPSKAFNIAGLQIANIIAPDAAIRARIDRAINDNEVCDVNPFGVVATIAAYNHGEPWLDALRRYLHDNYLLVRKEITGKLITCKVSPLEGTYLAWIDFRAKGLGSEELDTLLREKACVQLSPGTIYGAGGDGFMRLNFACPRHILQYGLDRIVAAIKGINH